MLPIVLAAAAFFTSLPAADEQDVRCLAFLSRAAGKVAGEERLRVDGGAIWYFGRLAARSPALDVNGEVARVLSSPAYDRAAYEADKQRCRVDLKGFATSYEAWAARHHAAEPPLAGTAASPNR